MHVPCSCERVDILLSLLSLFYFPALNMEQSVTDTVVRMIAVDSYTPVSTFTTDCRTYTSNNNNCFRFFMCHYHNVVGDVF